MCKRHKPELMLKDIKLRKRVLPQTCTEIDKREKTGYEMHLLLAKQSRSQLPLVLKDTQCAARGAAIDMYGN